MSTIITQANYGNFVVELFRNDLCYKCTYGPELERFL